MNFKPGDDHFKECEDSVLRLESSQERLRRIQREFAPYRKSGSLGSDELIADRREEARREMKKGLC